MEVKRRQSSNPATLAIAQTLALARLPGRKWLAVCVKRRIEDCDAGQTTTPERLILNFIPRPPTNAID
jgi:hypothetical protein